MSATIVLDRLHRVAAVFLVAVLDRDLAPIVDRTARATPTPVLGGPDELLSTKSTGGRGRLSPPIDLF